MATPSADVLTKVSTDATEHFVESFYHALSASRSTLSTFYVPSTAMPDGKTLPSITFNGNLLPDATAFQTLFEKQMPNARYEVQGYDCHPLNLNYPSSTPTGNASSSGRNMSILVSTSGYVRFGEGRDGAMRGFSESIVLVPNTDEANKKIRGKGRRDWLIQSQNFRLTV